MVESTRAHERLAPRNLAGTVDTVPGPGGRTVEIFVPAGVGAAAPWDLVVHFHGAPWLVHAAAADAPTPAVAAVVNLGAGSGVYHRTFTEPQAFDSLLAVIRGSVAHRGVRDPPARVFLTAYSAGHGAVRVILREPRHAARVAGILLLDGMHTSYEPEGVLLAEGGALDTTNLAAFAAFARAAMDEQKRFVITHSEIFPGTYASTTETADWLVQALGLQRTPVLAWGPRGMQQLSEVRAGGLDIMGFAGNTAPDHIDHFHAMPELLARLLALR